MKTKVCIKCGREFPLTEEYFPKAKQNKDGFRGWCKECTSKYEKQYREDNKEIINKKQNLNYKLNKNSILKNQKQRYENNKDVILKKQRQYNKVNKEAIAERHKIYYEKNKEREKERARKWDQENKDKCRVRNRIKTQRYRARKRKLPSSLTAKQWRIIKQYFNNVCCYCGQELPLVQEHFMPASKGGEYTFNNIVPSCASCNSSKRDSEPLEWYRNKPYYSKQREKKILKFLGYKDDKQQLTLIL